MADLLTLASLVERKCGRGACFEVVWGEGRWTARWTDRAGQRFAVQADVPRDAFARLRQTLDGMPDV